MIELSKLTKNFGPITAVDDVSFTVDRGEVLGFLGPNGAGKSTTMKMVTGFLAPSSGKVSVCGFDVAENPVAAQRHIGYLPEGAPAWPDMTPESFLNFAARARGLSGDKRRKAVAKAAEMARIEGVMRQPIETLSKGFKRRVGLAQALLHDPDVLILDEPTDGLDPNQKQEVRRLISEMAGEKAIVISTHILEEVEAVCSRAVVIARGRLVADGTPQELERRDPRHNAVRIGGLSDTVAARTALKSIGDIAGIDEEADGVIIARPEGGKTIIGNCAQTLRDARIDYESMEVLRGRLETVFRDLTQNRDGGGAEPRERADA